LDTRRRIESLPDPPTSGILSPSDGPEREVEEVPMNAFLVDLENKPGELARITEAIATAGVNITAASGSTCGSGGNVAITTADDAATRMALKNVGASFREIESVETPIRNEPGSLARACRRLADAGVNVEALFATGMRGNDVSMAFVTNNAAKAREILASVGTATR
jgi:hypothetical protein